MIDRVWLKCVIEAARSILLSASPVSREVSAVSLCVDAGVRPPATEAERLILLGVAASARETLEQERTAQLLESASAESVVAFVRRHSRDPKLSRFRAARALGVSPSWLGHKLKAATGKSFSEHLTQCRLDDACMMLRHSSDSIKSIAVTAGFQSANAFTSTFHRHQDVSPGQWRRQLGAREAKGQGPRRGPD